MRQKYIWRHSKFLFQNPDELWPHFEASSSKLVAINFGYTMGSSGEFLRYGAEVPPPVYWDQNLGGWANRSYEFFPLSPKQRILMCNLRWESWVQPLWTVVPSGEGRECSHVEDITERWYGKQFWKFYLEVLKSYIYKLT